MFTQNTKANHFIGNRTKHRTTQYDTTSHKHTQSIHTFMHANTHAHLHNRTHKRHPCIQLGTHTHTHTHPRIHTQAHDSWNFSWVTKFFSSFTQHAVFDYLIPTICAATHRPRILQVRKMAEEYAEVKEEVRQETIKGQMALDECEEKWKKLQAWQVSGGFPRREPILSFA